MNYLNLYNLERYLFTEVSKRFKNQGFINSFDFFCIIIWKANRAKTKIKRKILLKNTNLEDAIINLTSSIFKAQNSKDKLRILIIEWEFRLPMASAILTVLYPNEFTIYDIRVCNELNNYQQLVNIRDFEKLWNGYVEFRDSVIKDSPSELDLREKDQWLWGLSFYKDLNKLIT